MDAIIVPAATLFLIAMVLNLAAAIFLTSKRRKSQLEEVISSAPSSNKHLEGARVPCPPGPTPLPIIGNMHLMAKFDKNPYEGFTTLAKQFGPVYKLQLGSSPCVIVSDYNSIMEVLIKKGNSFDGRPDFNRWNAYFDGNRQHSLALCDWSDIQKTRRNIVRAHLMLKQDSHKMDLDHCLQSEMNYFLDEIEKHEGKSCTAKLPISYCSMNVFMNYMCSTRFEYTNESFTKITKCFDQIFEDVNNGHPTDFMPWLSPFFKSYNNQINNLAGTIRQFILEEIIKDRVDAFDGQDINDLVDALLFNHLNQEDGKLKLDWQNILFALEDLLGGSSAISNVVTTVLGFIIENPSVHKRIQEEIDEAVGANRVPSMEDRANMKYTEATILETLRHISSPIVPHVANEDTSVGGYYNVEKGSVVLLNNYELNVSPSLWDKPTQFIPERFIVKDQIKKPSYFIPFSTVKRSCIGSRILMNVTFVTIAALLQRYNISMPHGESPKAPRGKLALEGDGFPIIFSKRFH